MRLSHVIFYAKKGVFTLIGITLIILLAMVLASHSTNDPGWSHVSTGVLPVSNLGGARGAWLSDLLLTFVGQGSWIIIIYLMYEVALQWWERKAIFSLLRLVGYVFLLFSFSALISMTSTIGEQISDPTSGNLHVPYSIAENMLAGGGIIGYELAIRLQLFMTHVWTWLFLPLFSLAMATLVFDIRWRALLTNMFSMKWLGSGVRDEHAPSQPKISEHPTDESKLFDEKSTIEDKNQEENEYYAEGWHAEDYELATRAAKVQSQLKHNHQPTTQSMDLSDLTEETDSVFIRRSARSEQIPLNFESTTEPEVTATQTTDPFNDSPLDSDLPYQHKKPSNFFSELLRKSGVTKNSNSGDYASTDDLYHEEIHASHTDHGNHEQDEYVDHRINSAYDQEESLQYKTKQEDSYHDDLHDYPYDESYNEEEPYDSYIETTEQFEDSVISINNQKTSPKTFYDDVSHQSAYTAEIADTKKSPSSHHSLNMSNEAPIGDFEISENTSHEELKDKGLNYQPENNVNNSATDSFYDEFVEPVDEPTIEEYDGPMETKPSFLKRSLEKLTQPLHHARHNETKQSERYASELEYDYGLEETDLEDNSFASSSPSVSATTSNSGLNYDYSDSEVNNHTEPQLDSLSTMPAGNHSGLNYDYSDENSTDYDRGFNKAQDEHLKDISLDSIEQYYAEFDRQNQTNNNQQITDEFANKFLQANYAEEEEETFSVVKERPQTGSDKSIVNESNTSNRFTNSPESDEEKSVEVTSEVSSRANKTAATKQVKHPTLPDISDDSAFIGKSRAFQTAKHRKNLSKIPPLSILDLPDPNRKPSYTRAELEQLSELLELKLQDFNIKADVRNAIPGPVVTRFEVELAPGVKAAKVVNISRDLARSLSMASLRVVEVIPGKPYIGIEVPNRTREMVRLIELLDTEKYKDPKAQISMAMGKDIGGRPIITDLAKAPHMLVAGTTGSGKSVLVNSMLLSMLLKYTPEQLRLILIDPKQLELANYNDIPHLLTPVVTDMTEAAGALSWCVAEMERRYQLMSLLRVRKLNEFNKKVLEADKAGSPIIDPLWRPNDSVSIDKAPKLKPLPMIVIVADEFADMMMQVGKQAEELITRLAQKSRAAGIHLMLATQRPSVDVITGLIKANVPVRAALRVNSKVDSRTILDQGGAEDMLGNGDMLFLGPGQIEPDRVHGAFVSDEEVNRVCEAWRERGSPDYIENFTENFQLAGSDSSSGGSGGGTSGEDDKFYNEAVAFILETRKVSASSIQRKFSIGYNRAARIVDSMEQNGIVSPMIKGKREILV